MILPRFEHVKHVCLLHTESRVIFPIHVSSECFFFVAVYEVHISYMMYQLGNEESYFEEG